MNIGIELFASIALFLTSLFGFGVANDTPPASVELGLREVSPNGEEGGFAVPASGCSRPHPAGYYHDCEEQKPDITVDKPLVRYGDQVVVSWNPKLNINCVLSENVRSLTGTPNPATAPNANAVGSRIDELTGEVTYTITCTGAGNVDQVTAKILPRIQET